MMKEICISTIQSDIAWEDKSKNLKHFGNLLESIAGKSDVAVLPEMFSTGFSTHALHLAETNEESTVRQIRKWAKEYKLAICGSFMAKEGSKIHNRGFFITPEADSYFYDKRHLFRIGEENGFTAGNQLLNIQYKGWRIRLIICYDLRFPVWCRNRNNEYDLLICVANWPQSRTLVWETLLKARALENQCYVCGVNRIGKDGNEILYQGNSVLIDFKGKIISEAELNKESVITGIISKEKLADFRQKFPVWMDNDDFEIK
jgi:predicted amidohydrolase